MNFLVTTLLPLAVSVIVTILHQIIKNPKSVTIEVSVLQEINTLSAQALAALGAPPAQSGTFLAPMPNEPAPAPAPTGGFVFGKAADPTAKNPFS